ncbi:MAG TPA: hypothetical protein VH854_17210, partial [Thermoanaerobaculia bacterium]|nr:hypothetical protein [Thermoanaerobaculia bacterium]
SQTTVGTNGFPTGAATATGTGSIMVAPNGTVTTVAPGVPQTGAGAIAQPQRAAAQPKAGRAAAAPAPHR